MEQRQNQTSSPSKGRQLSVQSSCLVFKDMQITLKNTSFIHSVICHFPFIAISYSLTEAAHAEI